MTGVVQSALGNLPELFVVLFSLHAHLYGVVRAAIVGSILANVLLVLGLAFLVGGLKHGKQTLQHRHRQADQPDPVAVGRRAARPRADRAPAHRRRAATSTRCR